MSFDGNITGPISTAPLDLGGSVHRSALVADNRVPTSGFAIAAVIGHALVIAAALFLPKLLEKPVTLRKPVIARLVAQGKPRPKGALPRKETPPPPATSAPAPPSAPALAPSTAPSKTAKTMPGKAPPRKPQPSRQELMRRALANAAGAVDNSPRPRDDLPISEREGLPEGSPQGTATDPQVGEKYFSEVHEAILANYVLPSVISERERLYLKASLLAFIGPDGKLIKHSILKPSGNALFDQALEAALQKTKLPAPPAELQRSLRDEGVELNFKP